jgi:hypothetical protein
MVRVSDLVNFALYSTPLGMSVDLAPVHVLCLFSTSSCVYCSAECVLVIRSQSGPPRGHGTHLAILRGG